MKKTLKGVFAILFSVLILTAIFFSVSPIKQKALATENLPKKEKRVDETKDLKLNEKIQNVICIKPFMLGSKGALAVLTGKGEEYKENIVIYICRGKNILYEITAADGYSPDIKFFLFEQPQKGNVPDKFLFYSSQTGGSGGYGNYVVYRLNENNYDVLYDVSSDNGDFSGEFISGGKMVIKAGENSLAVDVSYMDKTFYDKIFGENGAVRGENVNIDAISSAFPYYNGATRTYELITYRAVTAVAEVNRLGFIVQTLSFNGEKFIPTFTEFAIEF